MELDKNYRLTGRVMKSETKPRGCGGLITILTIKPDAPLEACNDSPNEQPEMNLPGRHLIKVGERVVLTYRIHSRVYWGSSYEIVNDRGDVLHSDVAKD